MKWHRYNTKRIETPTEIEQSVEWNQGRYGTWRNNRDVGDLSIWVHQVRCRWIPNSQQQVRENLTAKFILIGPLSSYTHISGSLMRGMRLSGWRRGVAHSKWISRRRSYRRQGWLLPSFRHVRCVCVAKREGPVVWIQLETRESMQG